jgi:hypothetical protein
MRHNLLHASANGHVSIPKFNLKYVFTKQLSNPLKEAGAIESEKWEIEGLRN